MTTDVHAATTHSTHRAFDRERHALRLSTMLHLSLVLTRMQTLQSNPSELRAFLLQCQGNLLGGTGEKALDGLTQLVTSPLHTLPRAFGVVEIDELPAAIDAFLEHVGEAATDPEVYRRVRHVLRSLEDSMRDALLLERFQEWGRQDD